MAYFIKGGTFYLEDETLDNSSVYVEGDIIQTVGSSDSNGAELIDLSGLHIMPGFIDIHIHGANGFDTMDGREESLAGLSQYKLKEGVTAFCPTTTTSTLPKTEDAIRAVANTMSKPASGAKILGAFLEGPYIGHKYRGAHNDALIRNISMEEIDALLALGGPAIQSFAIAPDIDHALEAIERLTQSNVNVRLGHTAASYESATAAIEAGGSIAIHTYNAMSPLNHREPGMVGAALLNPSIYNEVICDLIHLHPAAIRILYKTKGPDKLILITDCMMAGGLSDGIYRLGEMDVHVVDGVARTPDGVLAGSTLTILKAVENMHKVVGIPLTEVIRMATRNPARALGISQELGSLTPGKKADIIAINDNFELKFVMVDGVVKHHNN